MESGIMEMKMETTTVHLDYNWIMEKSGDNHLGFRA